MSKGYSFDEEKHVHTFDGKRMYGVTSILSVYGDKSGLINWAVGCAVDAMVAGEPPEEAKKAHTKKRDKAGDKGTLIHSALEVMMNDWIQGRGGQYEPIVENVRKWMADSGIKPLKSEMPVYSVEDWYAGIADGVIEKDGKKYILDFKTSGSVYTTAFYQMGAYSHAIKIMKPDAEIAGAVVVHIPRGESFNPEKNIYWFYDIEALERGFLNILSTYKTDKELEKLIRY